MLALDVSLELIDSDVEGVDCSLIILQLLLVRLQEVDLVFQSPDLVIASLALVCFVSNHVVEPLDLLSQQGDSCLILLQLGFDVLVLDQGGLQLGVSNLKVLTLLGFASQETIQPVSLSIQKPVLLVSLGQSSLQHLQIGYLHFVPADLVLEFVYLPALVLNLLLKILVVAFHH